MDIVIVHTKEIIKSQKVSVAYNVNTVFAKEISAG